MLKEGLIKNFANVEVEIVDCPDLTQEPFALSAPGKINYIIFLYIKYFFFVLF